MLEQLYIVQGKDLEIDGFEQEKTKTPAALLQLRKDQGVLLLKLNDRKAIYNELRKEVNANDLEISNLTARKKASSESAMSASSAKEASQYQNQELQFTTRLQELEEDTLPLMERLEQEEGLVKGLQTELDTLEPQLKAMNDEEDARLVSIDEATASLKQERQDLSLNIPAALLKQYEQVRRSKRGVGMALIMNHKQCGGCNMQLPMHVMQKVKKDDNTITRCPACGRILWNKPEEIEQ